MMSFLGILLELKEAKRKNYSEWLTNKARYAFTVFILWEFESVDLGIFTKKKKIEF